MTESQSEWVEKYWNSIDVAAVSKRVRSRSKKDIAYNQAPTPIGIISSLLGVGPRPNMLSQGW